MFSNIITIYGSALLVLQMSLFLPLPCTQALPITSKPIESTAEHLAWQAWLMLPPEQRNLEKSRKVTPKSIFTLPFRECPPGHQLYESRCIPTVNIDQGELLTQQLLGFVIGEPNGQQGNMEFDYEDEEEVIMYEPAQKLSGELGGDTPRIPSQDEPLKFNIFQHKFSTADYDGADNASLEGSGGGGAPLRAPENQTSDDGVLSSNANFMDVYKQFLERNVNATNDALYYNNNNQTVDSNNTSIYKNDNNNSSSAIFHLSTTLTDLQSESSSISSNVAASSNATPIAHMFAISEIDAIALPAGTVTGSSSSSSDMPMEAVDDFERSTQAHRVSLFKDDSAVQLVTTIIAEQQQQKEQKQQQQRQDMAHLLQADALLPITDNATASATATTTREPESTFAASESGLDFEATTVMNADLESETMEMVKAERTRSVTEGSGDAVAMNAAELDFSTTTEPTDTTHIQLDETTIIEAQKSKVEPVSTTTATAIATTTSETKAESESATETETHSSSSTSTAASFTPAAEINKDKEEEAKVATITTKRIIPTTTTATAQLLSSAIIGEGKRQVAVADDRFYKQLESGGGGGGDGGEGKLMNAVSGSGVGVVDDSVGSTSSSSETSEINIEQELRMINALVKGNQQRRISTSETPATTTSWTSNVEAEFSSRTTTNAESSFTTEINEAESMPATSKSNKATKPATTTPTVETPNTTINIESTQQRDATTTTTTTYITEIPTTVEAETNVVETSSSTTTTNPTTKTNTHAAETVAGNNWPTVMPIVSDRASTNLATSSIHKATSNVAQQMNSIDRDWIERDGLRRFFEFFARATATTTPTATTTTQAPSTTTTTTTTETSNSDTYWWLPLGWHFDGPPIDDDETTTFADSKKSKNYHSSSENNKNNNKEHSDDYDTDAESMLSRLFATDFERHKTKGGLAAVKDG